MINLSNPMLSVIEAEKYLYENKHNLSEKEIEDIEGFIFFMRKDSDQLSDKWLDSKIFKLAQAQEKRLGRAIENKVKQLDELCYDYDYSKIFDTMHLIQVTAEQKGIQL